MIYESQSHVILWEHEMHDLLTLTSCYKTKKKKGEQIYGKSV